MSQTLRNIKILLAYDGSGYHGWQIQTGQKTVQETVEKALSTIFNHKVRCIASGRTDAGVHALGQVINFPTTSAIPVCAMQRALNSILPDDISIRSVEDVAHGFHSRYMALSKTYTYVIDTSKIMSPFLSRYVFHFPWEINPESVLKSLKLLEGEHDFSSFMGAGSPVNTACRKIFYTDVFFRGSLVYLCIKGSGFLRHMVRNIVGTIILIKQKEMCPEEILSIMDKKDRSAAGPTAPPQGLYLVSVEYDKDG